MKDDLISRRAAIEYLMDNMAWYCEEGYEASDDEKRDAITELISGVPTAQPQWIQVSERLPEGNGRYLVTRGLKACNSIWNRVYIINYSDLMGLKTEKIWWRGNVGKSDFQKIDDVIAWCELPEPYQGGEQDG